MTAWDVAMKRLSIVGIFVHEDAVAGNGVESGAVIAELGGGQFRFVPRKGESCLSDVVCLYQSGDCRRLFR